jgi:hypothetical protein
LLLPCLRLLTPHCLLPTNHCSVCSPDGRFLAAAEPADYVTLYDAAAGYQESQVIDLFGELAGISFTPEGDRFYASVSDVHYSSVLQFEQHRAEAGLWPDAL